jgi:hypothetical protein
MALWVRTNTFALFFVFVELARDGCRTDEMWGYGADGRSQRRFCCRSRGGKKAAQEGSHELMVRERVNREELHVGCAERKRLWMVGDA